MTQRNTNVRLLACLVDPEDIADSDYRFLVDGQSVKYIVTTPKTFSEHDDDPNFEPILLGELFPPFPPGDWNKGYVSKGADTGHAVFTKTETVRLSGVENRWCPVIFNELDFTRQDRLRQRVHVCVHPQINDGKPVLMKLAVWPWEIDSMEVETTAYQWLHNTGIGPKFLGHVTEGKDGRILGFVVDWIDDAQSANSNNIDACCKALSQLHELGIKLGDANEHNFLVREGHDVVLVDFEFAARDCSRSALDEEMNGLRFSLGFSSDTQLQKNRVEGTDVSG